MRKNLRILAFALGALLASCGPSAESLATQTAEAAAAAATRIAMAPITGLWEGSTNVAGYAGSVSFEIDPEGNVREFHFSINFGFGKGCVISADRIEIGADQVLGYTFGNPVGKGENFIRGEFSNRKSVSGSISNSISCVSPSGENIFLFSPRKGTWSAELKTSQ